MTDLIDLNILPQEDLEACLYVNIKAVFAYLLHVFITKPNQLIK